MTEHFDTASPLSAAPKRPLKVFLCHAHSDKDTVKALYTRLTNDGVDAWLDKENLLPGQDWELEIRKAVREADVVIVCLSKQFNQAGFRQKEVRWSLDTAMEQPEGEIFIIPARLEECDTLENLRKWHWVDLFDDRGYAMLTRALRERADKIGRNWPIEFEITKKPSIDTKTVEGKRTIKGLSRLKVGLDMTIPPKTTDKTLLLATWNIREFGGTKSGGREKEPLQYIAEIISRFDIVAVQEVRDDLAFLNQLMDILGERWKYLVSDVILGVQGNIERHTFIYDTRKVSFSGLAGELVSGMKKAIGELSADFVFSVPPYIAGFQAGSFKFSICCQNFKYGISEADDPQRVPETQIVLEELQRRLKSKNAWGYNIILIGDFNIFSTRDGTFKTIEGENFVIPEKLKGTYTNAARDKSFEQIAFLSRNAKTQVQAANGGTFPFFDYVYRDDEWQVYQPDSTLKKYKHWRTFKISDHLPLWVEIVIDF